MPLTCCYYRIICSSNSWFYRLGTQTSPEAARFQEELRMRKMDGVMTQNGAGNEVKIK